MTRLLRLALGLVVAFVFAGRMEAATQHCVRLAHEMTMVEPAVPSCHMTGMEKQAPAKPQPHHSAPASACECVAFAKSVTAPAPALASSRIAAFAWERPQAERFASLDLAPDGPPPKA